MVSVTSVCIFAILSYLQDGESYIIPQTGSDRGTADRNEPAKQSPAPSPDPLHAQSSRFQRRESGRGAVAKDLLDHRPLGQDRPHQEEHGRAVQIQAASAHEGAHRVSAKINFSITIRSSGRALRISRSA